MSDWTPAEDRFYGPRYAESAHDRSLYVVAGRVMADLKTDQAEGTLPAETIIVVAVRNASIAVKVMYTESTEDSDEAERIPKPAIRRRVAEVLARYNHHAKNNPADQRYAASVEVRTVLERQGAAELGAIIG